MTEDRAVSLNAVIEILKKMPNDNPSYWNTCDVINRQDTIDEVLELPSVEPQEGEWIEEDMFDGDVAYRCSKCGELFTLIDGTPTDNLYNFCPACGARLNGGDTK